MNPPQIDKPEIEQTLEELSLPKIKKWLRKLLDKIYTTPSFIKLKNNLLEWTKQDEKERTQAIQKEDITKEKPVNMQLKEKIESLKIPRVFLYSQYQE